MKELIISLTFLLLLNSCITETGSKSNKACFSSVEFYPSVERHHSTSLPYLIYRIDFLDYGIDSQSITINFLNQPHGSYNLKGRVLTESDYVQYNLKQRSDVGILVVNSMLMKETISDSLDDYLHRNTSIIVGDTLKVNSCRQNNKLDIK